MFDKMKRSLNGKDGFFYKVLILSLIAIIALGAYSLF